MGEQTDKLGREEVAKREIGVTDITATQSRLLVAFFLFTILAVPIWQILHERAQATAEEHEAQWPSFLSLPADIQASIRKHSTGDESGWDAFLAVNSAALRAIEAFESRLEDQSVLIRTLMPPTQLWMTRRLGAGNESAYPGRDGWLFFRAGVDYLSGPPFLDPKRLAARAASGNEWRKPPQPDPRIAILAFRDQLAKRGIELIVVPTPIKPSLYPEKFGRSAAPEQALHNPSYAAWKRDLSEAGVRVFEADSLLYAQRDQQTLYLETDTHWTPAGMDIVATALADYIRQETLLPDTRSAKLTRVQETVSHIGDIALMMQLPEAQMLYPKQEVTIQRVLTQPEQRAWSIDKQSDVLVLGDSFSNIFSWGEMGWGSSAGFVEQLSFALDRPLDAIRRNDAGAYATREKLSRELARGSDRLAGKRLVIWQFAERELSLGDWKALPMKLGEKTASRFFVPEPNKPMLVRATLEDLSDKPRPRQANYADHRMQLHLVDLRLPNGEAIDASGALVNIRSMQARQLLPVTRLRPGDELYLRLQRWKEVEEHYGSIRESSFDSDLSLEVACWGELVDANGKPLVAEVLPEPTPAPTPTPATSTQTDWKPLDPYAAKGRSLEHYLETCRYHVEHPDAQAPAVVHGFEDWLFLRNELRHLSVGPFWGARAAEVSKAKRADRADPLPAILDFNQQMQNIGVELIFMPVPTKASLYPDKLSATAPETRIDTEVEAFLKLLEEGGVTTIDLAPIFRKARSEDLTAGTLHCRTDAHWSPRAIALAAEAVRQELENRPWYQSLAKESFQRTNRQIEITGDLVSRAPSSFQAATGRESLPATEVTHANGERLANDPTSPILLTGDSHCLVFHLGGDMHTEGMGLPDLLAASLGHSIDTVAIRGSGTSSTRVGLMRTHMDEPDYLPKKKVILWVIAGRDFTESRGWRQVPIIEENAAQP